MGGNNQLRALRDLMMSVYTEFELVIFSSTCGGSHHLHPARHLHLAHSLSAADASPRVGLFSLHRWNQQPRAPRHYAGASRRRFESLHLPIHELSIGISLNLTLSGVVVSQLSPFAVNPTSLA